MKLGISLWYKKNKAKVNKMSGVDIIDSIKIFVYPDDHNPPHFHAIYAEYEEVFAIKTLETLEGKLPKPQRKKIVKWAKEEENKELLIEYWNCLNPTKKIK